MVVLRFVMFSCFEAHHFCRQGLLGADKLRVEPFEPWLWECSMFSSSSVLWVPCGLGSIGVVGDGGKQGRLHADSLLYFSYVPVRQVVGV